MKASQLLRGALEHLSLDSYDLLYSRKETFVCKALEKYVGLAYARNDVAHRAVFYLIEYIKKLVNPTRLSARTLESWALDNIPGAVAHKKRHPEEWREMMQAYRHRWVKHLVKEFEAKGE